jgi:acetyltransferase
LKLASFSHATLEKLKRHLPYTASIHNPVDVIGDATHERYESAIRDILLDEAVDGAIVILTPQTMTDILETARILPRVAKGVHKPLLSSFMGLVDVSEGVKYLEAHGIPNYLFPEAAARTMAAMVRFTNHLKAKETHKRETRRLPAEKETAAGIIAQKLKGKKKYYMPEKEANEVLRCYGFPLLKNHLVNDVSEIGEAVEEIGFPLAMKVVSPDVVHKSDVGGVRLKISSVEQARQAFGEIVENVRGSNPAARLDGVLVEEMAKGGVEVILGATRDPRFGPICMFGLGGAFVETIKDVTFRLAPMWELSAEIMIRSIKAYKILQGVRGDPPSDTEAIKLCILRLSQMVSDHPEIAELDINPLIVYPAGHGCMVADSRILLSRREE